MEHCVVGWLLAVVCSFGPSVLSAQGERPLLIGISLRPGEAKVLTEAVLPRPKRVQADEFQGAILQHRISWPGHLSGKLVRCCNL